jgi:hypothetical protein
MTWTYDVVGRLTQVQDSLGGTIARSYSEGGLRSVVSVSLALIRQHQPPPPAAPAQTAATPTQPRAND